MKLRRHVLTKRLFLISMTVSLCGPSYAQTFKTPTGELRVGMNEEEASRILHSGFEEIGGINALKERIASMKVGDKMLAAAVTSKHVVYSVSSEQFFPNAELGQQAADEIVQRYHSEFSPSAAIARSDRGGIKYQSWLIPGGPTAWVELHCGDTLVILKFSDYSRKAADDGEASLRYVTMGPAIDPECF